MRTAFATAFALLACAGLSAAQTKNQNTTETKVGVSLKGIEVTRKKSTTTETAKVQKPITVTVDGSAVAFEGQGPIMRSSRVLVPLRGVFEKMGATVNWDRSSNTVTATKGDRKVVLPLNGRTATVAGQTTTLDQPAMVLNGRALVPLRFLSESLGASVDWRAADMTVAITGG